MLCNSCILLFLFFFSIERHKQNHAHLMNIHLSMLVLKSQAIMHFSSDFRGILTIQQLFSNP
jgi:hypothetical protein